MSYIKMKLNIMLENVLIDRIDMARFEKILTFKNVKIKNTKIRGTKMDREVGYHNIDLQVVLRFEDYKNCIIKTLFKDKRYIYGLTVITLFIIGYCCFVFSRGYGIAVMMPLIAPVGVLVFFIFIAPIIVSIAAKNLFTSNKLLNEQQNYSINESGISVTTESSSKSHKWGGINKVVKLKNFFVIYTSNNLDNLYILPMKDFTYPDDAILFEKLVNKYVNKKD